MPYTANSASAELANTSAPILACPSWCPPERLHDDFAAHVGGEFAGKQVRGHERLLTESTAKHGHLTAYLVADDVIDFTDQGVTVERTPEHLELIAEVRGGGTATLDLTLAEADELVDRLSEAVGQARRLLGVEVAADSNAFILENLPRVAGRALSLAGVSVKDAAGLLGIAPRRELTLRDVETIADEAGVPASGLFEQAHRLGEVDERPVIEGGQLVEAWRGQDDPSGVLVLLGQVVDVDGPGAIVGELPVANGSGRIVGTEYTLSTDAAEAIRAAIVTGQVVVPA